MVLGFLNCFGEAIVAASRLEMCSAVMLCTVGAACWVRMMW